MWVSGEAVHVEESSIQEISALSAQFFCEPKTALKITNKHIQTLQQTKPSNKQNPPTALYLMQIKSQSFCKSLQSLIWSIPVHSGTSLPSSLLFSYQSSILLGTSLMVQWLKLHDPNTGGPSLVWSLVRELDPTCRNQKSHVLQLRPGIAK